MVRRRQELRSFRRWEVAVPFLGIVCGLCASLSAQTTDSPAPEERNVPVLTAQEHPWAHFLPKSWARIQTITTTEQAGKKIRNVTETKTILEAVDETSLTLKIVSTVDVGGRTIETPPQKKIVDFFQEPVIEGVKIEQRPSTMLTVDKQLIPCEVRSYLLLTPETRQRTTVWYSTQIYPYVLRVERILKTVPTEANAEEKILGSSTTEVLETDAMQLRRSKFGTYRLRTIAKNGDVTTIAETSCSRHLPGGLRQETVRELDRDGKEIRTTETRLINYYYLTWANQPDPDPPRPRRKHKEIEN